MGLDGAAFVHCSMNNSPRASLRPHLLSKSVSLPIKTCPVPTNDHEMSAGSDACDYVGGDTFPLSVIVFAERSELEAATWKGVVLASTGLPYLGQTTGIRRKKTHTSEACHKSSARHRAYIRLLARCPVRKITG